MEVFVDRTTPALRIESGESRTVCDTGPQWVARLLEAIAATTTTTTTNSVRVVEGAGGSIMAECDISLQVAITMPPLLPVPSGPVEKSGSDSLQKLLDKDMPPAIAKFREGYLARAPQSQSA